MAFRSTPAQLNYTFSDWSLGINLGGAVNHVQTFLRHMTKQVLGGHESIPHPGGTGRHDVGSALLHGQICAGGTAEALRRDLEPHSIGVSAFCLSPVAFGIIARSSRSKPGTLDLGEEQRQKVKDREQQMTAILHGGTSTGEAGTSVLDAVQANRSFVHTDAVMRPYIEAGLRALLAVMPG